MRRTAELVTSVAGAVVIAAVLGACGDDDRQLVGYVADQPRQVDVAELPDVSDGGAPFRFEAADDGLLLVYFGYTNCPDACPNTMGEVKRALGELGDDAERIDVAMVTVDPQADTDVLTDYVQAFVPDAHAIATDDLDALRRVASAFDATFGEARVSSSGVREVDHSVLLYAVNDEGVLALSWPLGTGGDDLAADIRQLLDE